MIFHDDEATDASTTEEGAAAPAADEATTEDATTEEGAVETTEETPAE
ncbi:hypothetical protein KKA15_05780 [Patescibacteria group bacterium]|nr:hypothetical protein [Patescibacteria group bacterium]